jgi:hypothetical protein
MQATPRITSDDCPCPAEQLVFNSYLTNCSTCIMASEQVPTLPLNLTSAAPVKVLLQSNWADEQRAQFIFHSFSHTA